MAHPLTKRLNKHLSRWFNFWLKHYGYYDKTTIYDKVSPKKKRANREAYRQIKTLISWMPIDDPLTEREFVNKVEKPGQTKHLAKPY